MDFEDRGEILKPWTAQGVRLVRQQITPEISASIGQASFRRRSVDRPGLEYRLLRNAAVVPRPRRALREHLGGSVGSLRRRPSTNIPPSGRSIGGT